MTYYQQKKAIAALPPEEKLRLLNSYMKLWVKKYPMPKWYTFQKFLSMVVVQRERNIRLNGIPTSGSCGYCGVPFSTVRKATKDHITPKAHGGTLTERNTKHSCERCNQWKGSKTIHEWKEEVQFMYEAMQAGRISIPNYNRRMLRAILYNLTKLEEHRVKAA